MTDSTLPNLDAIQARADAATEGEAMTDHYEMPHAQADECPHAGVGKACRPCRDRFERAPITPDERAEWRALADRMETYYGEADAADGIRRLLDALDTAEYERDEESVAARLNLSRAERAEEEIERLRATASPVRPDRAPQAEPDGSHVYAFDETEGCWIAYRRVDCVSAEELPGNALWPGRSEAEVKAEALREAADAMDADPEFRDPLRLKSDWLRAHADRIEGENRG